MGWRRATPADAAPRDAAERDAVEAAIAATPRANHLPKGQQQYADLDRALPIGYGQTNSQPTTVRAMLRALRVGPGMRVLDVGSGSGWTTVLLARLVGDRGRVIGVERIPELVAGGARAVQAADVPWASVRRATADVLGVPEEAPFDRILVSAQSHAVPRQLVEQLTEDGLMVVPVNGQLLRVDARGREEQLGSYVFVPLVTDDDPPWD